MFCTTFAHFQGVIYFGLLYSFTPEATKDWGSMVEEEEARTQTKEKTNPRYGLA